MWLNVKKFSKYAKVVVSIGVSFSLVLGVGVFPLGSKLAPQKIEASNTYIAASDKEQEKKKTATEAKVIAESGLNLRAEPSLDSKRYFVIPHGTVVQVLEEVNASWVKVKTSDQIGFVFSKYIKVISEDKQEKKNTQDEQADWEKLADEIIKTAYSYEGSPYRYGAKSGSGYFDCSLFTQTVFSAHGIDLPRDSRSQFATATKINKKDLRKGDLVFFSLGDPNRIGHVAIYIGEDKLIHATTSGVAVTSFEGSEYYSNRYKGATRVIQ